MTQCRTASRSFPTSAPANQAHPSGDDELVTLLERATAGDPAAWNALVNRYNNLLWAVARRFRLGDAQAADAVQTTWLRLVEHIGEIRDPKRLAGWLKITAERVCIQSLRRAAWEYPVEEYHDAASAPVGRGPDGDIEAPELSLLRLERQDLVRTAMTRLPLRQRELMTMLLASPPVSYEEIGGRLTMPVGSIGPTRARILRRLRGELEAVGFRDCAVG